MKIYLIIGCLCYLAIAIISFIASKELDKMKFDDEEFNKIFKGCLLTSHPYLNMYIIILWPIEIIGKMSLFMKLKKELK